MKKFISSKIPIEFGHWTDLNLTKVCLDAVDRHLPHAVSMTELPASPAKTIGRA
jgi:hypothetical protein